MRAKVYQLKKEILEQADKDISTSCSLPNWQLYRIKSVRKKLMKDLKVAGLPGFIAEGKIEQLALKMFMRKMTPREHCSLRAVKYNDDHHSYSKINLNFENPADYFLFKGKRQYLRVSVSYLMDLALRQYLNIAARILFLKLTNANLKAKWHTLIDHFSNYNEIKLEDTSSALHYKENHQFSFNSG